MTDCMRNCSHASTCMPMGQPSKCCTKRDGPRIRSRTCDCTEQAAMDLPSSMTTKRRGVRNTRKIFSRDSRVPFTWMDTLGTMTWRTQSWLVVGLSCSQGVRQGSGSTASSGTEKLNSTDRTEVLQQVIQS